jgi:hypothetical protein
MQTRTTAHASPAPLSEDQDSAAACAARGGAVVAAAADECFPACVAGGRPDDPAVAFDRTDAVSAVDHGLLPRPNASARLRVRRVPTWAKVQYRADRALRTSATRGGSVAAPRYALLAVAGCFWALSASMWSVSCESERV